MTPDPPHKGAEASQGVSLPLSFWGFGRSSRSEPFHEVF